MRRYFMRLAYNGAPFHGWQVQPNAVSVQSTLEAALSTLLRCETPIVGAGRTDAGVNAAGMVAHFDAADDIDVERLPRAINSIVGPDIAVERVWPVHQEAHARFDAVERTYHYYTHRGRNPFVSQFSWQEPPVLDFDAMNEAARLLLTTDDFTSFAKLHTDVKTNLCRVTRAEWLPMSTDLNPYGHVFVISADRFLRNMVRAVVGTLVDVGRGKLSISGFSDIIDRRDRCAAGTSMPAHALFLWDVKYPY
ncbi:MAG: tRNA pseudouridine(38-40) synthase TruA [Muribaculum sp.]|nr:tRNA pseudouridine(38-40) synthase TruA [Muribaculum sp.]